MQPLKNLLIVCGCLMLINGWLVAQRMPAQVVHSLGDGTPHPWTSLPEGQPAGEFQFAVVSDNSGTPRPGIWREAMQKLNLLRPEFVMSIGDLIEGYVSTPEQLHQQWDEFFADLAPLQVPFFFVSGNHDVGRPLWYDVYRQRIGPTWYYFIYRDVLFLVLDTNDGADHGTGMSDQQIDWIEQVLVKHPASSVRWTMVFQHKPLWNDKNPQWNRIKQMLADRQQVTVLAGHIHEYMATEIDGIECVAMATTGGGSPLRGRDAGEVDHVMWVTMSPDGPTVANLELDGILPIDFRTNQTAEKYKDLSSGKFLQVSNVHCTCGEFTSGETTASFQNPIDQPLRVKVLMEPQEGLVVRPAVISELIAPNGQFTVDLEITTTHDVLPVAKLQPVVLHWQATYDQPAAPAKTWSGVRSFYIDGLNSIPAAEPKRIDGKLDDWPELPYVVSQPGEIYTNREAWRGGHDTGFRFGLAASDDRLFCAIEVQDDCVSHDGEMLWQDFAGLFVNPIVSSDAKPQDVKRDAFAVMAGLSMSEEDLSRYQFGNPPKDMQTSVSQDGATISYEFSIPTQRFSELQSGRWSQLQINVIVSDHDPDDQRSGLSILYWRPRWDGMFHYPTSGIFQRQGP